MAHAIRSTRKFVPRQMRESFKSCPIIERFLMAKYKQEIQRVALGAAIFRKNRLFLLKRGAAERTLPGKWELPGGKREFFETSEQGIFREVLAKAGFPILLMDVLSVFDDVLDTGDLIVDSTQINFLAEPATAHPAVRLSKEHADFAWIAEPEIDSYEMSDTMRLAARHAFKKHRACRTQGCRWKGFCD